MYQVLSTFYLWKEIIGYTLDACDEVRALANKQFEDWAQTAPIINSDTGGSDLNFFLVHFANWNLPTYMDPTRDGKFISVRNLNSSYKKLSEDLNMDYLLLSESDSSELFRQGVNTTKKHSSGRKNPRGEREKDPDMSQRKMELSESYWHPGESWFEYQNRRLKDINRKTLILCQRPLDTSFIDRVCHILLEIRDFSHLRPYIPMPVRKLRPNARASASPWIAYHEAQQFPYLKNDPYYRRYSSPVYPEYPNIAYTTSFGQPQEMKMNTHVDERKEFEIREHDCFYPHYTPMTNFAEEEPRLAQLLKTIVNSFSLEMVMDVPQPDFLMVSSCFKPFLFRSRNAFVLY